MLYILLGIALLICLILSIKLNLHIIYEDEILIYIRILFIKIKLLPNTNNRFNLYKFTSTNTGDNTTVTIDGENANSKSNSIIQKLNFIREIISIFSDNFRKHLHVKLAKIHVKVATPDAAQTAILYGAVSTAVACIIDLIDDITNLKPIKNSAISVEPDFLSERSNVKLNIVLYVSALGAIKVLMKSFIKYYSSKNKTQIYNRKENNNG